MSEEPTNAEIIARIDRLEKMLAYWFYKVYARQLNVLPGINAIDANRMAAEDAGNVMAFDEVSVGY